MRSRPGVRSGRYRDFQALRYPACSSDSLVGWTGLLDLCDPFDIIDLEMTAAFEDFQRVLFVSEPQPFGLSDPKRHDAGRGIVPGPAMRGLPVEIISDSAGAPFRNVLVERWSAVVTGRDAVCRASL